MSDPIQEAKDRETTSFLQTQFTAAEQFKTFVHGYLDQHGVPHGDPENQHQKEGCRIGARLDLMFARTAAVEKERDEARADHAGCVTRWREALTNPIPSPGVMREPVESLYRQTEALRTKLDEALARVKELEQTNLRIREYNYNADLKIELLEEQVRSLTSVLEDGPTAKQKGVRAELDKLKGTK